MFSKGKCAKFLENEQAGESKRNKYRARALTQHQQLLLFRLRNPEKLLEHPSPPRALSPVRK